MGMPNYGGDSCSCVRMARTIEDQSEVHSVVRMRAECAPEGAVVCGRGCGMAWYVIPHRLASLVAEALQGVS